MRSAIAVGASFILLAALTVAYAANPASPDQLAATESQITTPDTFDISIPKSESAALPQVTLSVPDAGPGSQIQPAPADQAPPAAEPLIGITHIPEPSTILLSLTAVAYFLLFGRRRRLA